MSKKSLQDHYKEGTLDSLPSEEEAKTLAKKLNQEVLTNVGWPEEITGKEKKFIVTPENFKSVFSAVVARPRSFPVRIPVTYKIKELN